MKEFAVSGEDEEMVSSHLCAELCDVACFCYDQSNPNSFEYAANLQVSVERSADGARLRKLILICQGNRTHHHFRFSRRCHHAPLSLAAEPIGDAWAAERLCRGQSRPDDSHPRVC